MSKWTSTPVSGRQNFHYREKLINCLLRPTKKLNLNGTCLLRKVTTTNQHPALSKVFLLWRLTSKSLLNDIRNSKLWLPVANQVFRLPTIEINLKNCQNLFWNFRFVICPNFTFGFVKQTRNLWFLDKTWLLFRTFCNCFFSKTSQESVFTQLLSYNLLSVIEQKTGHVSQIYLSIKICTSRKNNELMKNYAIDSTNNFQCWPPLNFYRLFWFWLQNDAKISWKRLDSTKSLESG